MFDSAFLIQFLEIVIWPITLLVIVYWFKKEFRGIFGRLSKMEVSSTGISIETFQEQLDKAKKLAKSILPSKKSAKINSTKSYQKISPIGQIRDMKMDFERELRRIADAKKVSYDGSPNDLLTNLKNTGIIDIQKYNLAISVMQILDKSPNSINQDQVNEVKSAYDKIF